MYTIIVNPRSGGRPNEDKLREIEKLLTARSIEYRVMKTGKPGDAAVFAEKAAADKNGGIIVMGGDGTFSEVTNGIGESGTEVIFAPCGTGNDFMRMFSLPKDTVEAVKQQLDSPVRMIDLGKCNDRYFLNVTGCGFDVDVLIETEKFKDKASSIGAYLRGAYSAIRNYRPMDVAVIVDDGKEMTMQATVISVGNGSFIGGGMKAVPGATVDDGTFDLMIAGKVNRLSIYGLLLLFIMGKHVHVRSIVKTYKCKKVRIMSKGMHLEADGEIFDSDDVTLSVIPGALRTRLPK